MRIDIIEKPITRAEAKDIAKDLYEDMVKGVVDVEREMLALGGEWHMDANVELIKSGSKQCDVWGFNYYPDEHHIEFVSLINIRPAQNNRKIEIQDETLRKRMDAIIRKLIV